MFQDEVTYKKMQEMLPDYAFDRLSEEDKMLFENNLSEYPDLQKEVDDVRTVFIKLEDMDYNKILERRTKNLSVKIGNRTRSHQTHFLSGPVFKFVIPTVSLIIAFFIIFDPFGIFYHNNENTISKSIDGSGDDNFILNGKDAMALVDSSINEKAILVASASIAGVVDNISSVKDASKINRELDELIEKEYSKAFIKTIGAGALTISNPAFPFGISEEELNYLSEDEFQAIMEALEDEDFNS